jgi:hypothetical protein
MIWHFSELLKLTLFNSIVLVTPCLKVCYFGVSIQLNIGFILVSSSFLYSALESRSPLVEWGWGERVGMARDYYHYLDLCYECWLWSLCLCQGCVLMLSLKVPLLSLFRQHDLCLLYPGLNSRILFIQFPPHCFYTGHCVTQKLSAAFSISD